MPKSWSQCNVNVSNGTANCNPDPVPVSRASNKGIEWVMTGTDYVFTGVDITANVNDFGTPSISTNQAGKSVMTVTDTVADLGDYSYTINYADANGNDYSHDPKIHNKE